MNTRQHILDAAERTIQAKGLAKATTKDIAAAAGCAEGTLFNYFRRKEELLLAAICEKVAPFAAVLREDRVGQRTVADNLVEVGLAAVAFHEQALPLVAALFADPELLTHYQERLQDLEQGPRRAHAKLAAYIAAEQRLGRIRHDAQPLPVAALLLGPCFEFAFERHFLNQAPYWLPAEEFVRGIVDALMKGLAPQEATPGGDQSNGDG